MNVFRRPFPSFFFVCSQWARPGSVLLRHCCLTQAACLTQRAGDTDTHRMVLCALVDVKLRMDNVLEKYHLAIFRVM